METRVINVGNIPYQLFHYAAVGACHSLFGEDDTGEYKWYIDIPSEHNVNLTYWIGEPDNYQENWSEGNIYFQYDGHSKIMVDGKAQWIDRGSGNWEKAAREFWELIIKDGAQKIANHLKRNDSDSFKDGIAQTCYQYFPYAFNPITCVNLYNGLFETIRLLPDYTFMDTKSEYCYNPSTFLYKCIPAGKDGAGGLLLKQLDAYGFGDEIVAHKYSIYKRLEQNDKQELAPVISLFDEGKNIINNPIHLKNSENGVSVWGCLALNGYILGDQFIKTPLKLYGSEYANKVMGELIDGFEGFVFEYSLASGKQYFFVEQDTVISCLKEGEEQIKTTYSIEQIDSMKSLKDRVELSSFISLMSQLKPTSYSDGTVFSAIVTDVTKKRELHKKEVAEWEAAHPYLSFLKKAKDKLLDLLSRL